MVTASSTPQLRGEGTPWSRRSSFLRNLAPTPHLPGSKLSTWQHSRRVSRWAGGGTERFGIAENPARRQRGPGWLSLGSARVGAAEPLARRWRPADAASVTRCPGRRAELQKPGRPDALQKRGSRSTSRRASRTVSHWQTAASVARRTGSTKATRTSAKPEATLWAGHKSCQSTAEGQGAGRPCRGTG